MMDPEDWIKQLFKEQRRAIEVGDTALRDHIEDQIKSVRDALTTADNLEKERIAGVKELLANEIKKTEESRARLETDTDRRFGEIEKKAGAGITEEEYEAKHGPLEAEVGDLKLWKENITGRMVGFGLVGMFFTSIITALIVKLLGG